ncbi:hypothetical protein XELAEV_18013427mg [Xenopus laevis]|uniref:Uncharacterized protein n=1 Tax=Xenopus laevis TaxID=8355 RepID=A0A974DPM4_XENLA|nr:hypothetical protein XELAEV_18013427mg [Xenopus laevis]
MKCLSLLPKVNTPPREASSPDFTLSASNDTLSSWKTFIMIQELISIQNLLLMLIIVWWQLQGGGRRGKQNANCPLVLNRQVSL